MALVTVDRYRVITGDYGDAPAAVDITAALADAVALLEDELGRPLEQAERTDLLYPDQKGRLYPKVTPLVSVPAAYTIDGGTVLGASLFWGADAILGGTTAISLTYTAGYLERSANPSAANRLPEHVERDLAWAAHALARPATVASLSAIPAGARAVSLGDASVSFGEGGAGSTAATTTGVGWSPATLRLRRRRL